MGWHWGILASSGGKAGSFDLLQTTVLSTTTYDVTFSNLANYSAYKHLQIRATIRNAGSYTYRDIGLRFNSDTGSNYAHHGLYSEGGAVAAIANTSQTFIRAGIDAGASATANAFAANVIDILDFNGTKNKTIRSLNGSATNFISLYSGVWLSTSAPTSITLFDRGSGWVSGSRFSLYGVK